MAPLVIAFGLGVGVLVSLTGIGGGSLMTPLLLLVIGTQPAVAVGTDIAYGALTKTVGGWRHLRGGTVDLGVSKWLAFGSVPGAVGGVIVVESLPSPPDQALLWGVTGALAFTAVVTLARALFLPRVFERERETVPRSPASSPQPGCARRSAARCSAPRSASRPRPALTSRPTRSSARRCWSASSPTGCTSRAPAAPLGAR